MIEIVDIVGEVIKPGNLIAFSKGGIGELQVGIVIEIFPDRLTYFMKTRKKKYKQGGAPGSVRGPRRYRQIIGYGEWKIRKGWIMLVEGEYSQNRLVVINNPLFLLNNPNIAAQMEVIDMAKDAGLLPSEYIFGQSLDIEISVEEDLDNEDEE